MISPVYVSMYSTCQPAPHGHMLGTGFKQCLDLRLWVTGPNLYRIRGPIPRSPSRPYYLRSGGNHRIAVWRVVWVELQHVSWVACMRAGHCTVKEGRVQKEGEKDSGWSWLSQLCHLLNEETVLSTGSLYTEKCRSHHCLDTGNRQNWLHSLSVHHQYYIWLKTSIRVGY